ncbi:ankyrin repeat-containing protein [Anaeramoeba ignava]|uniref:Ankyrin repeat-containing protein n=1 Tax=Anaeramoeba ignava TaxID=1746090 RepID=A0A9Q0RH98_ANAIG|nr:ankyrin repeat-containing protein [Anaeramoeba ignava]
MNLKLFYRNFPLHLYCKSGSSQNIVELLIKSGADINCQNGETPLHFACLLGDSNFIHFLVSIGAKINVINKDTPLHFTCRNYKNLQSIYWLCLFGSEIHLKIMKNQLIRREFCDYEIKLKDCVIPVHKLILQTRIGETKFEKQLIS